MSEEEVIKSILVWVCIPIFFLWYSKKYKHPEKSWFQAFSQLFGITVGAFMIFGMVFTRFTEVFIGKELNSLVTLIIILPAPILGWIHSKKLLNKIQKEITNEIHEYRYLL